ncbi:hypothetical protein A4A49_55869, partial [Nicotiana attenuata]
MDLSTNCFFVCRDVVFKEHIFPFANSPSQVPVAGEHTKTEMFATEPLSNTDLQPERTANNSSEEATKPRCHDAGRNENEAAAENVHSEQHLPIIVGDGNTEECAQDEQQLSAVAEDNSIDMSKAEAAASSLDGVRLMAPGQQQSTLQNEIRRYKRTSKEPLWLQDYVTTKGNQGS